MRWIGEFAYELAPPPTFSAIYLIFHVSMLYWYIPDESHILQYDSIELDNRFTYFEEPIAILASDVH